MPDLVKLLDAVGRLVEDGAGPNIHGLHEEHQRMMPDVGEDEDR